MRGSKIAGLLFTIAALLSLSIPGSLAAQGATADQYYAAGNKLSVAKNYAQAAKYYYAAVKLNPSHAASYQGLGNCYYALGRKKDALAFYQRASALQPTNAQLAQFVRSLAAQVGAGSTATAPTAQANYLAQGSALFQQKQYAASIPYFGQAIKQTPNDYRPYYYAGYAYYMTGNAKNAALYFGIANAKQPNASIKAYADKIKAGLALADQQWVDSYVARYGAPATGLGLASATPAATPGSAKSDLSFGFHLMGGMEYILNDPAGIIEKAQGAGSVSLTGVTPSFTAFPEFQPFVKIGDNFEVNLTVGYFPAGLLAYTTYDFARSNEALTGGPDLWKYTFNTTVVTADLGGKIYFGDKGVKGYLGLSAGISPISMKVGKSTYDYDDDYDNSLGPQTPSGPPSLPDGLIDNDLTYTDIDSKDFTTMAFSAQAILGVDFSMGKDISIGPYVGYRYLSATEFKNGSDVLVVDQGTGAVGVVTGPSPSTNVDPLNNEPLVLDFSGIVGGVNITFSF